MGNLMVSNMITTDCNGKRTFWVITAYLKNHCMKSRLVCSYKITLKINLALKIALNNIIQKGITEAIPIKQQYYICFFELTF